MLISRYLTDHEKEKNKGFSVNSKIFKAGSNL